MRGNDAKWVRMVGKSSVIFADGQPPEPHQGREKIGVGKIPKNLFLNQLLLKLLPFS